MRIFTILALAIAIGLATAASPFASSTPDGLEKVAGKHAFIDKGRAQDKSVLSDYAIPGVHDARLATGLAGFAGTLAVFALGYGVAAVVRRRPVTA
jgi:PDGLE domain